MIPFAHPYIKFAKPPVPSPNIQPWKVVSLCASYGWPTGLAGGGVIGIVELGGGYLDSDNKKFFSRTKLPMPSITNIAVDPGAGNNPGSDADYEVSLDIQVAAASYSVATGKPATIVMFWANNDAGGISRAIARAASYGCDVCSISWGEYEGAWGKVAANQLNMAAESATSVGMVIFAASGDNNSGDSGPGNANVDLPAASPFVVGCGGTLRPRHANQQTNPEVVWDDEPGQANGNGSGGGWSAIFSLPTWQQGLVPPPANMRLVPDVAGNASPRSGYHTIVRGNDVVVGGTSAVSPLYAGLGASFGKKLGEIHPIIWAHPEAFRTMIPGNNGQYTQPPCPGPVTGMGSPYGAKLAALFVK